MRATACGAEDGMTSTSRLIPGRRSVRPTSRALWHVWPTGAGAVLVLVAIAAMLVLVPPVRANAPLVMTVGLNGTIDSNAARYVERAIAEAVDAGAEMLVIELDSPGGLSTSTRTIVSTILESPVPIAVFVTPRGAQAVSAGTFVVAAAGVAAMSPGSTIGAASPIGSTGRDLSGTLAAKVLQDTRAFARSISDARGRDATPLEAAIIDARSYSAREALEVGIVDVLAEDLPDLLRQIDGLTVPVGMDAVELEVADVSVRRIERTLLERFIGIIASPNVAFILLSVGSVLMLIELSNPGSVLPGTMGAISLGLAFVGLGQLPVNWLGVALILISLSLLYLEIRLPGISVFGAGFFVAFVAGAILLLGGFHRPAALDFPGTEALTVSGWLVVVIGSTLGITSAVVIVLAHIRRPVPYRSQYDRVGLVGKKAKVIRRLDPHGEVWMLGEFWIAHVTNDQTANEGSIVMVTAVRGAELEVASVNSELSTKKPREIPTSLH